MTSRQLVKLARNHSLLPDDTVRRNESAWVPARSVKGLFTAEMLVQTAARVPLNDGATVALDPADDNVLGSSEPASDATDSDDESPTKIVRGLPPGSLLGNYIILEKLGEGGMGMVLKAQHRRMDRLVALKVLHGDATRSPAAVKRFEQEVRAAARLVHQNIVTAHDADEGEGVHFLVMEYVDGTVLSDLLAKKGPLPLRDAVNYVLQAARGLAYAHSEGIVHRDIKPGNLLLDKRGTIKILDMGLARIDEAAAVIAGATAAESLTKIGQVLGTLDYMSPEQAEDARRVDHRSDIYSLGCSFYRLLTGKPPYGGETIINKIVAHRDHPIPSIAAARKGMPADIDAVFRRMVAKNPDDRYPSMDEVIVDLEMFLANGRVRSDTLRLAKPAAKMGSGGAPGGKIQSAASAASPVRKPTLLADDEDDSFELAPLEVPKPAPAAARPAARVTGGSPVPAAATTRYYCKVMGEDLGPLTLEQLSAMKRKKQISREDMVRRADEARWFPAADIEGLF